MTRSIGVVLPGCGALGAWQAACLAECAGTLRFDKLIGFSAGAMCGTAYFTGRIEEMLERWREVDRGRILRFSPSREPLTLFSGDSLWEAVESAKDDERLRREATCELTIVAYNRDEGRTEYFRFTPKGERGWDGPLHQRLVASCAIPLIFPPVVIAGKSYADGVVPGSEPMSFEALEGCTDVLVLQPIRPEEGGREYWNPWRTYDQKGRNLLLKHVDDGLAALTRLPRPPRVHRLIPSRELDYSMLSFRSRWCGPAMEQGRADARAFLGAKLL